MPPSKWSTYLTCYPSAYSSIISPTPLSFPRPQHLATVPLEDEHKIMNMFGHRIYSFTTLSMYPELFVSIVLVLVLPDRIGLGEFLQLFQHR